MRRKRLLWQIYPSFLIITLVSLAAVTWYASSALRNFYIERTESDLLARAILAEEPFRRALEASDFSRIDPLCKELGKKAETRITVILPDGTVVGDTEELPARMDNHADRPEVIEAYNRGVGASERYSKTVHNTRKYKAIVMRSDGRILGVLRMSVPMAAIDESLQTIQSRIAVGGLFVAMLLAAVSLLLSRRISRPLEELKRGAARFAQGDLGHTLPMVDSQEIDSLAETLNKMAAELDERIRSAVEQRNEREAILASMVEGVLAIDPQQRLIWLNRAAARLLGTDPDAAAGRSLAEMVRSRDLQQLVADVLTSHEPGENEIALRQKGERFLHAQATVLRDARQRVVGVLLVLHELTRLKQLEKVRRDFVANVSHELRTPVTSIKGFVETLLEGAMHRGEDLQRFLRIISSQADRLGAIIEDLLMLSRIEQEGEKAEIVLAPASIQNVLETAAEVCQMKAAEKEIAVQIDCPEDLLLPVNAPLLEQAVINLLDNAINYSSAGQIVSLRGRREEKEIAIEVRDDGCGISREHLPRIFERFYRVDKARSRKLGGTGLGLAIVKHIAQLHGGRASVDSVLGVGSTFTIHLPCVAEKLLDDAVQEA